MTMAMMQPDSKFRFGKYSGKTIKQVAEENPSYLCWMRKTGFSDFGKEVTEAIFAWEEANPAEVAKTERSIAKKAKRDAEERKVTGGMTASEFKKNFPSLATAAPLHDPLPPPVVDHASHAEWGTW